MRKTRLFIAMLLMSALMFASCAAASEDNNEAEAANDTTVEATDSVAATQVADTVVVEK